MADDWKSYVDLDGTHVHVAANAPTTLAELIERHGIRPGLLVTTAAEAALLTELLDEAWRMADFVARSELVPRITELQARIDATLKLLAETDELTSGWPLVLEEWTSMNSRLIRMRAALQGDQPEVPGG